MLFYEYRLRPAAGWTGDLPESPPPDYWQQDMRDVILAVEKDEEDLIFCQISRGSDWAAVSFQAYCELHGIPIGALRQTEITAFGLEMLLRRSDQIDHKELLHPECGPLGYLRPLLDTPLYEWMVDTAPYRTETMQLAKARRSRCPGLVEMLSAIHGGEGPRRTAAAFLGADERSLRGRTELLVAARHGRGELKSKRICVVRPMKMWFSFQNLVQLFREQQDATVLLLLDGNESDKPLMDEILFYRLGALVEQFSRSVHTVFAVTKETQEQLQLVEKGLATVQLRRLGNWETVPPAKPAEEPAKAPTEQPVKKERKRAPAPKKAAPLPGSGTAMAELQGMIGLKEAKEIITQIVDHHRAQTLFAQRGFMPRKLLNSHMVFYGGAGCGKTTVARLLGRILHEEGVLSKGHLVEVDRSGLVAGYIGQTALKTKKVIEKARGGVLFIDEAYALSSSDSEKDFGQEAIQTLLKMMEDYREDLVVITAGYEDQMRDFIRSNPGLESRFSHHIHFPAYTEGELLEIFQKILADNERTVQEEDAIRQLLRRRREQGCNPRQVRNMIEQAVLHQASRLMRLPPEEITNEDIRTLLPEDFPAQEGNLLRKGTVRKIGFRY